MEKARLGGPRGLQGRWALTDDGVMGSSGLFSKSGPLGVFQRREVCSEKELENKSNEQVSVKARESAWEKPHSSLGNVQHPWSLGRTDAMPPVQTWLTPRMSLGEVGMGQAELP